MKIVLVAIIAVILVLVIYFKIPYSRLRTEFNDDLKECSCTSKVNNKYTLSDLPECMQKFYKLTGLDKKTEATHVSFKFKDTDFMQDVETKKKIKIDYDENIFGGKIARLAFIDSSMFGIPFQGLDSFIDGKGGMKGVVAKNITIFNVRGEKMDKAALVTWLGEAIMMPSQFLNGTIRYEEIDKNTLKVSVDYDDIYVDGIYKFTDDGRVSIFTTNERGLTKSDGTLVNTKWTAVYDNYADKNGLFLPGTFKAVWNLEKEDVTYFDGKILECTFN